MSRKSKDGMIKGLIYGSAGFTVLILAVIIGFILMKGLPGISIDFLTRDYENKTTYVTVQASENQPDTGEDGYIPALKAVLDIDKEKNIVIDSMDKDSPLKAALNLQNESYAIEKKDRITKYGNADLTAAAKGADLEDADSVKNALASIKSQIQEQTEGTVKLNVVRPGGGIVPMGWTSLPAPWIPFPR